jgi:hypothetical protein
MVFRSQTRTAVLQCDSSRRCREDIGPGKEFDGGKNGRRRGRKKKKKKKLLSKSRPRVVSVGAQRGLNKCESFRAPFLGNSSGFGAGDRGRGDLERLCLSFRPSPVYLMV